MTSDTAPRIAGTAEHTTYREGENCGCQEFATSRRRFLASFLAAAGASIVLPNTGGAFVQAAFGAVPGSSPNILVVISMRGGADGLSIVVPHGDPLYYTARPTIAVPKTSLLVGDSMFGLHPNLKPIIQ